MLRDFPEKEANFRPLWTQFTPDSSLQVRVGFPYAPGQRRVCPDVDAPALKVPFSYIFFTIDFM